MSRKQTTSFVLSKALALALIATPFSAQAADKYWVCSTDWWDNICWSSINGGPFEFGQPLDGDNVYLYNSNVIDITVNYQNIAYPAATLDSLIINATDTGTMTLSQTRDNLQTLSEIVGDTGTGTVVQTGGTHSVTNSLILGNSVGSNGSFTVSDTASLSVGVDLYVGNSGTGNLTIQNGGTVSSATGMVGLNDSSSGSVTVDGAGSSWTNSTDLFVGGNILGITGTLNVQNAGSVDVTGTLNVLNSGIVNLTGGAINTGSFIAAAGNFNFTGGTLTIDGGTYSDGNADLVINSTIASPTLVLTNGASATPAGDSIVGSSGTGTLIIQNGGSVNNTNASTNGVILGDIIGSSGNVTVDGVGSSWTNSADLYVGNSGTGSLTIQNGGIVSNTTSYLGNTSSSNGSVTVDGAGSSWTNSGFLYVGNNGTGTLTIQNGGAVSNTTGYLGDASGSSGSVTVDGAGSSWTNSGFLYVGNNGMGMLSIQNGGVVSNTSGYLGNASGSSGSVSVDGAGANWINSGSLNVGFTGTGSLIIQNGGAVSSAFGFLGEGSGSSGSVSVDGAGSSWTNSADLYVGDFGSGNLTIQNGGTVFSASGYLGVNSGSSGSVTVQGAGSSWTNSADLYVGASPSAGGGTSSGTLNVNNAGTVNVAGTLQVWDGGTVNLTGGIISTSMLDGDGTFNFNAGTLNISSNFLFDTNQILGNSLSLSGFKALNIGGTTTLNGFSILTLDGGTFSTGSLINNGGFAFNSGTFNLTNDNLVIGTGGLFGGLVQFDFGQMTNVSNTTTVNAGSILALNNSSFSSGITNNNGQIVIDGFVSSLGGGTLNNAGILTGSGQVSASLNNTSSGEVQVGSGDTLRFTAAGNTNSGQINLSGGTARFDQDLTNTAGGVITGRGTLYASGGLTNQGNIGLSSGNTDLRGDINNDTGGTIIVSGGATATFFDDIVHNGTEIRVSTGSQAVFFGAVSGSGSYTGSGSVFFEGDLTPGNSPALINMGGDMNLGLNSRTIMEIGGLLRGDEYDAFDINGTLSLGGELDVILFDSGEGLFDPILGNSFDLFAAETIAGSFDLWSLAILGDGLGWQLDVLADEIGSTDLLRLSVVSTVPVPPAVWLFGSGLLGLVGVARRRQKH